MKAEGQSQKETFTMEEGAKSQGTQQLLEAGTHQGDGFPLKPPEGMQLCRHLDVSPVRLSFDLSPAGTVGQ